MKPTAVVGWVATVFGLTGVAIQSLLPQFTDYSFPVFLVGSCLWLTNGTLTRNRPLIAMQSALLVLNGIACVRIFL